jgi:outer membrane protein OmpA-like peptidoglycan-associated protein
MSQGVDGRRVATQGFGESRPIAGNDTEAGRQQNRRVELQLTPLTQ